ncbi:MAG: IS110 family transposase, partial [Gammaproteobacteria bacterium]|nr:IS110 family transposase [Gammaproteobacteria bacterium]
MGIEARRQGQEPMESTNDGSRLDAVGVDVSKASLDAHRLSTGESRRFANDAKGIEELARWVGDSAHRVVYESTGRLHRELEARLAERLPLAEVNPLRARLFAKAAGRLAKTDKVDAKVLALMGATLARNRLHQSRSALLRHQHRNRLRQVARQVKAVDARIRE